jgi:hypothetical protein
MRKTTPCVIAILLALTLLGGFNSLPAKSQLPPNTAAINADGSIQPSTAPIHRNGDTYTFTGNFSGGLAIHKSSIVVDGAGFALNGDGGVGIDLQNNVTSVPSPEEIWNVTIKNLAIINFDFSVKTNAGVNNTFLGDYIANSIQGLRGGVFLWACVGNYITRCSISGDPAVFLDFGSSHNTLTANNLAGGVWLQMGGNEEVDGNYWADYSTKYPAAVEVNASGVGSIPYAFDTYGNVGGVLVDNHPQMHPIAIPTFADLPLNSPTPTSSPEATPTPDAATPEPTATAPELSAPATLAILFAAVTAATLVYRRTKK